MRTSSRSTKTKLTLNCWRSTVPPTPIINWKRSRRSASAWLLGLSAFSADLALFHWCRCSVEDQPARCYRLYLFVIAIPRVFLLLIVLHGRCLLGPALLDSLVRHTLVVRAMGDGKTPPVDSLRLAVFWVRRSSFGAQCGHASALCISQRLIQFWQCVPDALFRFGAFSPLEPATRDH